MPPLSIESNGKSTKLLSLVHVMFAVGLPVAKQVRVNESPSLTVVLGDMSVIFGGTKRKIDK